MATNNVLNISGLTTEGAADLASAATPFMQARLTLLTGEPYASGITSTTLYYTPYKGNKIGLYNGSVWETLTLTEISIAGPATTDTNYDVYVYSNAGTPTLELVAWTTSTAGTSLAGRSVAVALQDGIAVKTGDATRRYVGMVRTTDVSGQFTDTPTRRYVWNYYNSVYKYFSSNLPAATWAYTTDDTWRRSNGETGFNGSTDAAVSYVLGGLFSTAEGSEASVDIWVSMGVALTADAASVDGVSIGFLVDGAAAPDSGSVSVWWPTGAVSTAQIQPLAPRLSVQTNNAESIGFHTVALGEYVNNNAGTGTVTFYRTYPDTTGGSNRVRGIFTCQE